MKLFNIPAKRTKGQCDAMRCTATDITPGWRHPLEDDSVTLCERHANELKAYIESTNNNGTVVQEEQNHITILKTPSVGMTIEPQQTQNINKYLTTNDPAEADQLKEKIRPMALGMIPPRTLESILTDNLAIRSGAIESRQTTAEKINQIAIVFEITDRETRDKADQLVALVHAEEKEIKAEMASMYKPIKDAAKATKEKLDSWFGPTLEFYEETKTILKEKLGTFLNAEKERETKALESGNHEAAAEFVTDTSENVRTKVIREYAIKNGGINLPPQFLVPDETKNDEIVKLLPRELLRPNYDLINAIIKEHGKRVEIPDVEVMEYEDIQMKGKRTKK